MSLFISFEGGEGSGKSTQARRLHERLVQTRIRSLFIHEPGTTNLGLRIRDLIKGRPWGDETISHGAELFLFAAARAELVSKVLMPTLNKTDDVLIADRYADSTIAYQSYGRKLPLSLVSSINELATQGLMPNITFLLDLPPEEGLKRVGATQIEMAIFEDVAVGRMDKEGARRFEEEPMKFHERVRDGYLKLTRSKPDRWVIIDAMLDEDSIADIVWENVQNLLTERGLDSLGDGDPEDLTWKHPDPKHNGATESGGVPDDSRRRI